MRLFASFAPRSNRSRATFSTESWIRVNRKKEAEIPIASTNQGSAVEWKTCRVGLSVATIISILRFLYLDRYVLGRLCRKRIDQLCNKDLIQSVPVWIKVE